MSQTLRTPNIVIKLDGHENNNINENHNGNGNHNGNDEETSHFARRRWSQALALAEQLRYNTQLKKKEQLRQYTLDIPFSDDQKTSSLPSFEVQYEIMNSFQQQLLFAKNGIALSHLTEGFLDLKRMFNRMLDIGNNELQQVKLSTSITKLALLIILRSTESIVKTATKGSISFPRLSSIISYIRAHHIELPIHGRLLVDWYKAGQMLDLLIDDPDWLVQPRKAHWTMQTCNETLAWAHAVFDENYSKTSIGRAIYDRDDSDNFFASGD